jgi:hypothetical protein
MNANACRRMVKAVTLAQNGYSLEDAHSTHLSSIPAAHVQGFEPPAQGASPSSGLIVNVQYT